MSHPPVGAVRETPLRRESDTGVLDVRFTRRAIRYFGIEAVDLEINPRVKDINVHLGETVPVIHLGREYVASNPEKRRQKIVHELIHAYGVPHCASMRRRGYYTYPDRDRFSREVLADIERGSPQFDPGRFIQT